MSAAALRLRDDVDLLNGGATLEEWAEVVALVMSRSVVEDDFGMPLLAIGLDLLQDGGDPNVEARPVYRSASGGGPLNLDLFQSDDAERELAGVELVALRDIAAGEELLCNYFEKPIAGRYIERYGFVPSRLTGPFSPAAVELSFAPTDADDDFHFNVKEQLLQDVGLSTEPCTFIFSSEETFLPPNDNEGDWPGKEMVDKMVHILRLRHTGGAESYLLDSVYVDQLWYNCNYALTKDNETAVCKAVVDECDRWLERFDAVEEEAEDAGGIAAAAADVRRNEADILQQLKTIFAQELQSVLVDETRVWWADRQMDALFPQRKGRGGPTGLAMFDNA